MVKAKSSEAKKSCGKSKTLKVKKPLKKIPMKQLAFANALVDVALGKGTFEDVEKLYPGKGPEEPKDIPKKWHTCIYAPSPFHFRAPNESHEQRNARILKDAMEIGIAPESIDNWAKSVGELEHRGLLKCPCSLPPYKTLMELDLHPPEFPINVVVLHQQRGMRFSGGFKYSF